MLTAGALACLSGSAAPNVQSAADYGFQFEEVQQRVIPPGQPGAGLGWQLAEPGAQAAHRAVEVAFGIGSCVLTVLMSSSAGASHEAAKASRVRLGSLACSDIPSGSREETLCRGGLPASALHDSN